MRRTSPVVLVLCAVVLAGATAGCGEKKADAAEILASASDKTVESSTARMAMDMTLDAGGKAVKVHEDATMNLTTTEGTLSLDAAALGLPGVTGDIEARFLDGVMYMDFSKFIDAAGDKVPAALKDARWLRFDFSKLTEGAAALGNDPTSLTSSLQYLRAADKDGIETVGKADVRGTSTTHYRVDIDLATLREKLRDAKISSDARAIIEKGLDSLDGDSIHTDVWVDGQGRVRRQQTDSAVHVEGSVVQMHMTMELFDFGVKVHVEEPPPAEIFDLQDLTSGVPS